MNYTVTALLSERQKRILEFIRGFYAQHEYAPSLREIGRGVGLSSLSSVLYQLTELERMGWIRRSPNHARALVVLNPADGGQ